MTTDTKREDGRVSEEEVLQHLKLMIDHEYFEPDENTDPHGAYAVQRILEFVQQVKADLAAAEEREKAAYRQGCYRGQGSE